MVGHHAGQGVNAMQSRLLDAVPLNTLTGVGAAQSSRLAKIGLHTVQDLLLHLPLRYEDRTHLYPIGELLPGVYASVEGEVLNSNITFGGRRMMTCQISDGTGILTMRFFNFNAAMKNSLATGKRVLAYGEAKRGKYGAEMIHPEYRVQGDLSTPDLQETLTPVYPTTEGIKQATLRKLTDQALDLLDTCAISELLPPELAQGMMSLPEALRTLHRPPPSLQLVDLETGKHPAQQRLILEELLAHNLSMLALRAGAQRYHALPLNAQGELKKRFLDSLPFKPTGAQTRVVAEIEHDMALDVPMMRLVQGDVGSGKTLVAALAALRAIAHGKQVALMAPTELLAEQHANNFRSWFEPLGIEVGWLAGKQKGKARQAQQDAIASGQVQMIVGTHAIFQEQVQFNGLALVAQQFPQKKIFVLDCDQHGGNGTAEFTRRLDNLFNFSIYGLPFGCPTYARAQTRHIHKDRGNFAQYALAVHEGLQQAREWGADLVIYQAGMDCHQADPFGSSWFSAELIQKREEMVFNLAKRHQLPLMFVLAGGYQPLDDLVKLHLLTFQAALKTYF